MHGDEVLTGDSFFHLAAYGEPLPGLNLCGAGRVVCLALVAGTERGTTLRDNLDAFAELGLAPHVVDLARERDTATTIVGQPASMPVMISPTGVQAVHPDGEVAGARAAAARGIPLGCRPSAASRSRTSSRPTRRPSSRPTGRGHATRSAPGWNARPAPVRSS